MPFLNFFLSPQLGTGFEPPNTQFQFWRMEKFADMLTTGSAWSITQTGPNVSRNCWSTVPTGTGTNANSWPLANCTYSTSTSCVKHRTWVSFCLASTIVGSRSMCMQSTEPVCQRHSNHTGTYINKRVINLLTRGIGQYCLNKVEGL